MPPLAYRKRMFTSCRLRLQKTAILTSCLAGLDYRKLTDEASDPLQALEPVLSSQNVLSVSKLVGRVPLASGACLTPSAVHAAWLRRLFWRGDPQVLKTPPQTDVEFLHAYDTCGKYLDRLLPGDAVCFLDFITFSPEAANQVRFYEVYKLNIYY